VDTPPVRPQPLHVLKDTFRSQHRELTRTATDRATPPQRLAILAVSTLLDIQTHVANNPSTPPQALTKLAKHHHDAVREAVAGNPATVSCTLDELAADRVWQVRAAAAANPSLPQAARIQLLTDTQPQVSQNACSAHRHALTAAASQLAEPERTHALLLAEQGFPGPFHDLTVVIGAGISGEPQQSDTGPLTGPLSREQPAHGLACDWS